MAGRNAKSEKAACAGGLQEECTVDFFVFEGLRS